MRRIQIPLIALVILTLRCGSTAGTTGYRPNPCDLSGGIGNDSPNAMVCISADFTTVNPETVRVKVNQFVNFYVVGGNADLDIHFSAATPVKHAFHNGNVNPFHYRIQAKDTPSADVVYGNKYTLINRATGGVIDPTIIIEPVVIE